MITEPNKTILRHYKQIDFKLQFINQPLMSSEDNHTEHHEDSSHCPDCKKKYISSSQNESESSQKQRIIIPIRRDMLPGENNQTQTILKNLQAEIQNLKYSNIQKDRMIEDLKKQIQHKMTHYMIFGQINKQTDEINRLKTQLNYTSNVKNSRRKQVSQDQIRNIFRQESKKIVNSNNNTLERLRNLDKNRNQSRYKIHSTHQNYSTLRKQFMSPRNDKQKNKKCKKDRIDDEESQMVKQYYETANIKQVFKIGESKRKIAELEQKIKIYEREMIWMSNFVSTFIKTMQNLAYRKYQEQIIIPEWTLKKKAKTSWRYLKHIFEFLYQDQK